MISKEVTNVNEDQCNERTYPLIDMIYLVFCTGEGRMHKFKTKVLILLFNIWLGILASE